MVIPLPYLLHLLNEEFWIQKEKYSKKPFMSPLMDQITAPVKTTDFQFSMIRFALKNIEIYVLISK